MALLGTGRGELCLSDPLWPERSGWTVPKLAGAACSELVQVQVGASCPASPHQLPAHRPRGQETPVFTPTAPPKCRGCSRSCHRLMGLLAGSCPSPSSRAEPRPGAWAGGCGARPGPLRARLRPPKTPGGRLEPGGGSCRGPERRYSPSPSSPHPAPCWLPACAYAEPAGIGVSTGGGRNLQGLPLWSHGYTR